MTRLAKFARKLKELDHYELVEPVFNTTVYHLTIKQFREECFNCAWKGLWKLELKEAMVMLELEGAMTLLRIWAKSKRENSPLEERASDSEFAWEEVIASGLKYSKCYYLDLRLCYK